ncbi:hypothetical protein FRC04_000504 [Tulasnella sp. 424]|nr:hypothetical protein FRC04_000504 [Tulasnella sp. 424]KAG8973859.1 hypothetical protein FRC05_008079 [Tulasnella sp. 425]
MSKTSYPANMNTPSSPRFYAIVSSNPVDKSRDSTRSPIFLKPGTPPNMLSPVQFIQQLSPMLPPPMPEGDRPRWLNEPLPSPLSVGQTPAPENNHRVHVGDRFIFLGGDYENFRSYIVEAVHRAGLVPFEAKATRTARDSTKTDYWFPYVENTRVFIDPGKPWFKVLAPFESMAQARELGVPKRKWLFLDGRDQATREEPIDLAKTMATKFVEAVLGFGWQDDANWDVEWEMMDGTAERNGLRGVGWNWIADLKYGCTWSEPKGYEPGRY